MKKIVFLFAYLFMLFHAFGQDSILYRKGKSIPVQIQSYDKERLYYKDFLDPEFGTKSELLYKLSSIHYKDGGTKIIRNNLAKSFIGISLGYSIPGSYYANNNSNSNSHSGYAKTGGYGSMYCGIYLFKNWGIQLAGRYFSNPFSLSDASIKDYISSNVSVATGKTSSDTTTVSQDKWISRSLNIDLLYTIKFSRKFLLDVYGGVGVANITKPEFQIHYKSTSASLDFTSSASTKTAAIYTFGLRFRYAYSRHFAVVGGVESMFADRQFDVPRFTTYTNTSTKNTSLGSSTVNWQQSITVVNVNVGICYLFNRKLIK